VSAVRNDVELSKVLSHALRHEPWLYVLDARELSTLDMVWKLPIPSTAWALTETASRCARPPGIKIPGLHK